MNKCSLIAPYALKNVSQSKSAIQNGARHGEADDGVVEGGCRLCHKKGTGREQKELEVTGHQRRKRQARLG